MPWSAALAFLVGLGLLLFRPPVEGSLLAMGGACVLPVARLGLRGSVFYPLAS